MTQVEIQGQVGPQTLSDGTRQAFRQGKGGEQIVQELHGRFYETNYRGSLFMGGTALVNISNATYTTGTLTSSCTPIAGVWNPVTSPVNLVIVQALLGVTITALAATGGGPYVWAASVGNTAQPSTGANPTNAKSLLAAGSYAKDMSNAALTGLTTNLTVKRASALGGGSLSSAAFTATAVAMQTPQIATIEQIDGAIIVPPGGVLALLATTTPVAHSASSGLVWEEVPL